MIQYPILFSLGLIYLFASQGFAEVSQINKGIELVHFSDQQAKFLSSPAKKFEIQFQKYNQEPPPKKEEEIAFAKESNDDNSEESLFNKLQGIQQEIQELRTMFDKQAQDLKLLQQQQITFYKDLDTRIQQQTNQVNNTKIATDLSLSEVPPLPIRSATRDKLEIGQEGAGKLAPENQDLSSKNLNQIYTANEQISYLAAYDLLKNKRFDDALSAMKIFTLQYPRGGYTANAQYWLGELYMVKNNYPKAIEHFEMVLKKFPSSSKRAASTLKIGYALAASGKIEEAKVRLEEVLRNYPDTPTAQLATIKLESLGVS